MANSKMVQYSVWHNCNNKCKFCLIDNKTFLPKKLQLESIANIKENLNHVDWLHEFNRGVSVLGGELYFTNDKDIQRKRLGGYNKEYVNGNNDYEGMNNNPNEAGRFPANTILTYDETDYEEVCGGFPYTKTGGSPTGKNNGKYSDNGIFKNGNKTVSNVNWAGDSGSASRYFYCAKASKKDRDEGLDTFIEEKVNDGRNTPIDNAFQMGETLRKNTHPTVKPTDLCQYLVRLVSPDGATILDPFNGSGSTGKAVMYENRERNKNYKYIGIELTEEYLPIAKARIEYICNLPKEDKQQSLF